ncbi:MAG: hypothetical protein SGJ10_01385, partial [Bacteroidota bacterium]|nr:hypothetical protein [Bacteroidota bacterium]
LNHEYIHVNYYRWEWNILSHDYINVGAQVGLDFQYKLYKYICIDARLKAMKFLYIAEQYPENHHPMEKKTSTNNILYSIGISYSF